jgi:hypothetical protein
VLAICRGLPGESIPYSRFPFPIFSGWLTTLLEVLIEVVRVEAEVSPDLDRPYPTLLTKAAHLAGSNAEVRRSLLNVEWWTPSMIGYCHR